MLCDHGENSLLATSKPISCQCQNTFKLLMSPTTWFCCLLIVKLCLNSVLATDTSCPTWHYYNNDTGQCECGNLLFCKSGGTNEAEIRIHDCATSAEIQGDYYISFCPFRHTVNSTNRMYSRMPSNASQLDEVMCGPYNRRGFLCGECKNGYGLAVHSIDLKCANCSTVWSRYAISVYLFLQFVPIALIFICFVVFRFNVTSGPLMGYVIFCQTTIAEINRYSFIYDQIKYSVPFPLRVLVELSVTIFQFCSLQFVKAIIPPFCVSKKLTGIHVQILNLVPAIYPLVLVIISCILMELHARNYRLVAILLKPFKTILSKANITAVTGDAVFHAFASFIFLSNISVLFTTYQVINFLPVVNSTGHYQKQVLYTDPKLEWSACIPYIFVAAVIFMFITVIPSVFLCIYPTRVYRYLSRFLSARKRLAITAFAEALHSCFKDGLNGTRDYRSLAGSTLFEVLIFGAASFSSNNIHGSNDSYYILKIVLCMMLVCVIAYVKPCKSAIANISLSFHMTLFGILICLTYMWQDCLSVPTHTLELMFIVTFLSSHTLVAVWAGYTLTKPTLTRFGYQFHGPGCKVALSDMANRVRLCLCRRQRGYQEMLG